MQELRDAAERTLEKLTDNGRIYSMTMDSSASSGTSCTSSSKAPLLTMEDGEIADRVSRYIRKCQIGGMMPSLDDMHNITLNQAIYRDANNKRSRDHEIAVTKTNHFMLLRNLAASLVVSLWLSGQRSPYARKARRLQKAFDHLRQASIFLNRGLVVGDANLIPKCMTIYNALPTAICKQRDCDASGTSQRSQRVSRLCRCINSAPTRARSNFFAEAIRAAEALGSC